MEINIESIGGMCPAQAEGTVNGKPFYFRARHGEWTFDVAETLDDAIDGDPRRLGANFHREGDDPAKGYMETEDARRIVEECAREYDAMETKTE